MANITIFIPKYRIAGCNRRKWKSNHLSELNKAIRCDEELKLFFMKDFKGVYRFKRGKKL